MRTKISVWCIYTWYPEGGAREFPWNAGIWLRWKRLPLPRPPLSPSAFLPLLTPLIFSPSELFFRPLTQIMRCPTDSNLTYNEAGEGSRKVVLPETLPQRCLRISGPSWTEAHPVQRAVVLSTLSFRWETLLHSIHRSFTVHLRVCVCV